MRRVTRKQKEGKNKRERENLRRIVTCTGCLRIVHRPLSAYARVPLKMADLCAFTTGNKMQCEMRDKLKRLHRVIANRKREILVAAVLEKEKEEEGSNGKREKIGGITNFRVNPHAQHIEYYITVYSECM